MMDYRTVGITPDLLAAELAARMDEREALNAQIADLQKTRDLVQKRIDLFTQLLYSYPEAAEAMSRVGLTKP